MAEVQEFFEDAARALCEGRCEDAVDFLIKIEEKLTLKPDIDEPCFSASLERLARLADAAAEGISDARTILAATVGQIRELRTYDGLGKQSQVGSARKLLGKY